MECAQPSSVARAWRERDIDRAARCIGTTRLVGKPGSGEEIPAALMQRDGEDSGLVPEDELDAVAGVHVHIDISDAARTLAEEPPDRDGGIVVNAKARRAVGHRMVESARDVDRMLDRAAPYGFCRPGRGAGDKCGRFMHAGE